MSRCIYPLGYDAFGAELAGVLKHDRAFLGDVLVEHDPFGRRSSLERPSDSTDTDVVDSTGMAADEEMSKPLT